MTQISKATLALLLVLSVGLFCQQASALGCCKKYSKGELPFNLITGYSIQTIRRHCNINAVIFHTNTGRNICTDPSQAWVMSSVWRLKEKVVALKKQQAKLQRGNN